MNWHSIISRQHLNKSFTSRPHTLKWLNKRWTEALGVFTCLQVNTHDLVQTFFIHILFALAHIGPPSQPARPANSHTEWCDRLAAPYRCTDAHACSALLDFSVDLSIKSNGSPRRRFYTASLDDRRLRRRFVGSWRLPIGRKQRAGGARLHATKIATRTTAAAR
jgi:hypothetical protein